jgi:hypothetical protein
MGSYGNVLPPTLLVLGSSQIHEALRIREREVVIGVIGHCGASSTAVLEAITGQTGFDIQAPKLKEDRGAIPYYLEVPLTDISRQERLLLQKSTGINTSGRGDTTGHFGCTTHVEPLSPPVLRGKTEERITRTDQVMFIEPVCKCLQLVFIGAQPALALFPPPRGTEAGNPEIGLICFCQLPQIFQMGKIQTG